MKGVNSAISRIPFAFSKLFCHYLGHK